MYKVTDKNVFFSILLMYVEDRFAYYYGVHEVSGVDSIRDENILVWSSLWLIVEVFAM